MMRARSPARALAAGDRTVEVATIAELKLAAMHGALAAFDVISNSWRGEPTQYPRRTRQSSPATRDSRPSSRAIHRATGANIGTPQFARNSESRITQRDARSRRIARTSPALPSLTRTGEVSRARATDDAAVRACPRIASALSVKALVKATAGPGFVLRDVPEPTIRDDEVLIQRAPRRRLRHRRSHLRLGRVGAADA